MKMSSVFPTFKDEGEVLAQLGWLDCSWGRTVHSR